MTRDIERIILPLGAASESHPAIDTASRLAAGARARLHVVFVEEEELWHLAALPFARQVSPGAAAQPLTQDQIEPQWRAAAERARREIAAAAERHRVEWSFEVVRSGMAAAFSGTGERDLVVAGALTRPVAGHFRVESPWWSSLEAAAGPVLLARQAWTGRGAIVVMLRDRSARSARLLGTAAEIAQAKGARLRVICGPHLAGLADFKAWIAERVHARSAEIDLEIAEGDEGQLHRQLGSVDCCLLAVDAGHAEDRTDSLRASVEQAGCDLLIVR